MSTAVLHALALHVHVLVHVHVHVPVRVCLCMSLCVCATACAAPLPTTLCGRLHSMFAATFFCCVRSCAGAGVCGAETPLVWSERDCPLPLTPPPYVFRTLCCLRPQQCCVWTAGPEMFENLLPLISRTLSGGGGWGSSPHKKTLPVSYVPGKVPTNSARNNGGSVRDTGSLSPLGQLRARLTNITSFMSNPYLFPLDWRWRRVEACERASARGHRCGGWLAVCLHVTCRRVPHFGIRPCPHLHPLTKSCPPRHHPLKPCPPS
jgi:hypothetical protein